MPENIEVHADHVARRDVGGEFCITHPGVSQDHAECIQLSAFSIDLDVTELPEIHLRLFSWIRLVPVDCQDLPVISHWPAVLLDKGI